MKSILVLGILFLFVQCRSIEPIVPAEEIQKPPILSQKESSVDIPLLINLSPYFKEVESSLDKSFSGKEENCDGVSYAYAFNRSPIQFQTKGDHLYYEVDGKYSLKLNYCPDCTFLFDRKGSCVIPRVYASCGVDEPMRKVSVGYNTFFKITPDYKFESTTFLKKFETIDPCEITVFQYDATDRLKKEVTAVLKDLEKDIDKEIGSIDLKSQLNEIWNIIDNPVSLGKYGYLAIVPKSLSLSDISFYNQNALVSLNMTFQPSISTVKPTSSPRELPKLSDYQKGNGFDINLDVIGTYDSISSILSKELGGKSVQIKKNKVIFDKIEVAGAANEQLTLKVEFSGDRRGTLYLNGTPTFDSLKQIISFPDLTFDIETKNALLKSAKWLLSSKITDMMRQKATFDIQNQMNEVKKRIQKEMNRNLTPETSLKGNVHTIDVIGIYPSNENLIIRLHTSGEIYLSL